MDAILSDIHGNLEALDEALDSIERFGVDRVICLGNVVGYGPDPVACIERLMDADLLVAGDWDIAVAGEIEPDWPGPNLRQLHWNREQLKGRDDLIKWLQSGLLSFSEGERTYYHATPRDRSDWIFPEDVYCPQRLDRFVKESTRISFCGNNHLAGLLRKTDQWNYFAEVETEGDWQLLSGDCICSVGSVGQPRDGDARGAYVLCDGPWVRFIRFEYNHDRTAAKIRAIPEIEDIQGDRLSEGR